MLQGGKDQGEMIGRPWCAAVRRYLYFSLQNIRQWKHNRVQSESSYVNLDQSRLGLENRDCFLIKVEGIKLLGDAADRMSPNWKKKTTRFAGGTLCPRVSQIAAV